MALGKTMVKSGGGSQFLTPKQKQVHEFILEYLRRHEYAPSQQEIASHFGFRSLGTVQHYLNQLQQLGLLEKTWNARRGVKPAEDETNIPLFGTVAAGRPIEAVTSSESVEVPRSMLKNIGDYFSLRVKGDSMIEDGILEGDIIIVRRQSDAQNGQTVVALINNEATVKRYFRKKNRVELHPANPAYKPIVVENVVDFHIQGVLTGVIRNVL